MQKTAHTRFKRVCAKNLKFICKTSTVFFQNLKKLIEDGLNKDLGW